ncbi:PREDICTED: LOC18776055 [Prunus dulcis]|uniref:PREDICTED: LOC18776055 n=1 Tax=Prunus dulcis TaxID=3755 RepID=A0A5E4EWW4_PRUDU|nr:PREDICTED: LOC18776055 [Prunus dulcis]
MGSHRRLSETSAPELRSKLRRVVSGHEQMKIAFHQLKSQIRIGLFQAEEVFASLAIPLMKLVGLKTVEMANEDRFTTIIIPANTDSHRQSFGSGSSDRNRLSVKEEICAAKAAMAGKLVMEKQKDQLIQLIRILKRIETQVNARQSHMVQTLTHRRLYLHKFFHRAIDYLSTVDRVDHQTFRISVLKLLRAAFHEVGAVLGSVESDVEELLQDLGAQMCDPMVDGLGEGDAMAAREVRVELEAARNKASVAEASKFEALSRLREAEDNVSKLKECLKLLPEPNKASSAKVTKAFAPHKFLGMEKEQANDEKLLWALLEKKRKYQTPESPPGPSKLLPLPSIYKRQRSTRAKPTAVTRTYSPRARTTPRLDARIQLGSSPSATIQKAAPPKQISPKMHA